ncbi:hypothetical protein [Bifidobacterium ramosum]|uniref:Uncharacterized protein n=2 Tax=Bifidobacterium ramosum TaxID=1798158 RepID=A0A7K3TCK4_9BIFI|nr:hypothetical protein [Bifidobacterium ramosum]NEG72315.1 hypothetical protein [Bifidobacterium ramosum]
METMHAVTPSDTRRIASAVVLRNGGYRHAAQRRAAVAQLSKVLQSVSIAPAAPITGCITPENMMGTMPAVLRGAYEDNERRAALFMGMANGSISVSEAFDLVLDDEVRLTRDEFAELTELWRADARDDEVLPWAYARALAALTEYADEYVAAEALTIRADCLHMFRETRAYTPDGDMVLALLILLAAAIIQTDAAETYHVQRPPDILPLVSLLTIAAILAPRAPQFRLPMA